jgi:hypothetical protein
MRKTLLLAGAAAAAIAGITALQLTAITRGPGRVIRAGLLPAAQVRRPARELPNIAPFARVTVSSIDPSDSGAEGVADGRVDEREWESSAQPGPAWILLEWDSPALVEEVDLFDRQDPRENVTAGTLFFDDGGAISVSSLPVDGSPARITFPPRLVRSVRFRIDSAQGANVGLAEIMVRGVFQ